jgi:S1/P1 Nuclease
MPKATYSIVTKLMFAALGELPCQRHPDTDFILQNEATVLRNRQEFQRGQLAELANADFEWWARESFEIATKIAYRNGGLIGSPRGANKDCAMVVAAPVLPVGYVINARRIADRRIILAGYRLADLLTGILKL